MLFKQHIRNKYEDLMYEETTTRKSSIGKNYTTSPKREDPYSLFKQGGKSIDKENCGQNEIIKAINNEIIEQSFEQKNHIPSFISTIYPLIVILLTLAYFTFGSVTTSDFLSCVFLIFNVLFLFFGILSFFKKIHKLLYNGTRTELNLFRKFNIHYIFTSKNNQRIALLSLATVLENNQYHKVCNLKKIDIETDNYSIMFQCRENILKIAHYLYKVNKIKTHKELNNQIISNEIKQNIMNAYFSHKGK